VKAITEQIWKANLFQGSPKDESVRLADKIDIYFFCSGGL